MSHNKVFIIAEAGINHNGSLKNALKLVDIASKTGADAIKFQTFKSELVISKGAPLAEYQRRNLKNNETQYEMAKKLELDEQSFKEIKQYCDHKNIEFFSTAFDLPSLNMLLDLGQRIIKIPSGEITNLPFLEFVSSMKKDILLSTGMCHLHEVKEAFDIITSNGLSKDRISILHCNSDYPTQLKDVNLRAMITLKNKFNTAVGYSDHTLGIEVSVAAVTLGAVIVEKHLTLDNNLPGPDHKASLEPHVFKNLVKSIRNVEEFLGSSDKKPSDGELKNISIARRSNSGKNQYKAILRSIILQLSVLGLVFRQCNGMMC